jgi:CHASE2 domain-containing sensor protein
VIAYEHAPRGPWRAALAVAAVAATVSWLGFLDVAERRAVDLLDTKGRGAPVRAQIVIAGITPGCLERLGGWPPPRATHGRVIDRLTKAGARGILLDVITEHASPKGPADDAAFEKAVRESRRVVVPITLAANTEKKTGLPALHDAAFAVGHVNFRPGEDQVVRGYEARLVVDRKSYPALPLAAVALARGEPVGEVASGRRTIEFTSEPGEGFLTVPYADVLEAKVPDSVLAGKLVFIGSLDDTKLRDRHVTPVGEMHGVEVLATATATLLSPLPHLALGGWATCALLALVALAGAVLAGRPAVVPWRGTTRGPRTGTSRGASLSNPRSRPGGDLSNPRSRPGGDLPNPRSRPGGGEVPRPRSRPIGVRLGPDGEMPPENPGSNPSARVPKPRSKPAPKSDTVGVAGPVSPISQGGRRTGATGNTGGTTNRPRRMVLAPPPTMRAVIVRGASFVALVGALCAAVTLTGRARPPLVAPVATALAAYLAALFSNALARRDALTSLTDAFGGDFAGSREPLLSLAARALGPDYEDLELLGTGGSGFVMRAHWLTQDVPVAVKFLSPNLAAHPEARARFRRESTLLASLRHPALITVYAMSDAALPYFAMELMEGGHLGSVIEESGDKLTAGETGRLLAPIANALAYLHERGVAHRDVKPANILVDIDGNARLTDFSVAGSSEMPALTRAGQQLGTPVFMAPEALRGDAGDGRPADIYALAVVIYLCLSGRLPFAESMHPAARLLVEPARLSEPGLDPDLVALVMRGLAREPKDRPSDATEFERMLTAIAEREEAAEA